MYQSRAMQGEPIGPPVYGYVRANANTKFWEIDPDAAVVIQKIFHIALRGYVCYQIAPMLEEERVLTPAHYRALHGKNIGNRMNPNPYKWAQTTVAQILRRQEYCGDVINKKTYSRSFKDKKRFSLFSGFLRCGDCGCNLHYHFNQNNPSIKYFNCSNYVGNRGTCPDTHYVRLDFLECEVLEAVNQLLRYAHKKFG